MKEYKLSNGLTVWLDEDHSQSKVFGAVVVKAGAKDCPETGIAHYFEHIMFKGTEGIGTIDYEKEKPLLDAIAEKYDELAQANSTEQRVNLQKEINELSIRAAQYAIPNEFERLITRYGGSQLNAGTSFDYTAYFNVFSPQYLSHWAELNSERLIRPVFRLFQSELETVYEEKNMHYDFIGAQAVEKLTERYFAPHPYAYPIIGSTENLKTPRLSQMQQFYKDYYGASNMGLILCGDFNTETAIPVIEKAFSRLRRGEAPRKEIAPPPPFHGKEKISIKVPVPVVKALVLGFRGVPANHEDEVALKIVTGLLNNENETGLLDKLSADHKVMAALSVHQSMNEAGILGVAVVPKLPFQSYAKAEKLVWNEINRIKQGDFSDEQFLALKQEQRRRYEETLENITSRAQTMISLFSQGKSWKSFLHELDHINSLTKDDIMRTASRYFSNDYLYATKKTGRYPKDNLPKPDFKPLPAVNSEASSAYARTLQQIPIREMRPRYLDFNTDVQILPLQGQVDLYQTRNTVNDVFTFNMVYHLGTVSVPRLRQLAHYLPYIGTESTAHDLFRHKLQALGSNLSFEAEKDHFTIRVSGFDEHFNETLVLLNDFIQNPMPDDRKVKMLVDEEKVAKKAFFKSGDEVAAAMLEKAVFGMRSEYLVKPAYKEVKKLTGKELIKTFTEVQQASCDLHYCGMLTAEEVKAEVCRRLRFISSRLYDPQLHFRKTECYSEPTVFFYDLPQAAQSIIYTYTQGKAQPDLHKRHLARVFGNYFGGGMSSLMFQEIREFRSLAYRVQADYFLPHLTQRNEPGYFQTMLSTQADKTLEALEVLHALLRDMPARPDRIPSVRQGIVNGVHNHYPSFREVSGKIAGFCQMGYTGDPNRALIEDLPQIGMEEVIRFYNENVRNNPTVYIVAGNRKHINESELQKFGNVRQVKGKDIYRK